MKHNKITVFQLCLDITKIKKDKFPKYNVVKGIIALLHKCNFHYLVRLGITNKIQHLFHVLLHRQDIFKISLVGNINKFVLKVIIVLKKVYMNLLFVILELINITLFKNNALKLIKVIINLNQGKHHKFHVQ